MRDKLRALIAQLRLHGIAAVLDAEIERAEHDAIAAPELLYRLLSQEAASRQERSLAYRLRQAHLPWRWSLETFPFDRQPGVLPRRKSRPSPGSTSCAGRTTSCSSANLAPARPDWRWGCCARPVSTVTAAASTMPSCCLTSCTLRLQAEVASPSPQQWVQVGNHPFQTDPAMSPRQIADPVFEPGHGLVGDADNHHYKPRSAGLV